MAYDGFWLLAFGCQLSAQSALMAERAAVSWAEAYLARAIDSANDLETVTGFFGPGHSCMAQTSLCFSAWLWFSARTPRSSTIRGQPKISSRLPGS